MRVTTVLVLSLHNTGVTHRWSDGSDKDGTTLCVEWNAASQIAVKWNDWKFIPIQINGQDTSANILAACKAAGLETPCDKPEMSDGQCQTVWTGQLSKTPTHNDFTLTDNKFFYAGNQLMAQGSTVKDFRVATADNVNGQTLCVEKQNKAMDPQVWNGWKFTPVEFAGVANSANILAACRFSFTPLLVTHHCIL